MKLKPILIMVMLIFGATMAAINPIRAQTQPTIYVNPPSIINTSLVVGSTFTVNVSLRDVSVENDLVGVEFKLSWDPAILNGTTMVLPAGNMFQTAQDDGNIWILKKTIDKAAGIAWYLVTCSDLQLGYDHGYLPLTGNGVLATITFKVNANGKTPLGLSVHKLSNGLGEPIPHNAENGYFRNVELTSATVYVDPHSITNFSLVPSSIFPVNVSILNAADLKQFHFRLSFDPSILNAINVSLGDLFPPTSTITDPPWIDNTEGYVDFGATLPIEEPSITGDGTLAQIYFNVTGLGSTPLELSEIQLLDSTGESIPYTSSDGSFNNVILAKLYVNPPEVIDPMLVPPATFTIDINLYNIENMYGYEFNLTFNKDVLTCLSVTIHDVLNETNYSADFIISNTKGFLWVKVDYYPPATPITSYENITLATIEFRTKTLGVSVLDLHDTHLTDPDDQEIPHEVGDGLFVSLIRDVAVVDITPEVTFAYRGWIVQINVTVTNKGNLTETFDTKAYYDGVLIGTVTVTDLSPSANFTATFNWDTKDVTPCHNYTISAEATQVPYEMNTTDNFLEDGKVKVRFMGDINGDGKVDIFDAVLLADAAGSYVGHERWNPDADLDRSKYVDIFDAVLLSSNSGKTC
jgi:hypothetical protein